MVMVRVLPVMDVVMDFVFRISMRNGRGGPEIPMQTYPQFHWLGARNESNIYKRISLVQKAISFVHKQME